MALLKRFDGYISKHILLFCMWFMKKAPEKTENTEKPPKEYVETWKSDMLLRWIDLEARVTALEMVDREYKKRVRTKIVPEDAKDSNSMLIPE